MTLLLSLLSLEEVCCFPYRYHIAHVHAHVVEIDVAVMRRSDEGSSLVVEVVIVVAVVH